MHVSDDSSVGSGAAAASSGMPTPAGMTPGSFKLAELIRLDCNDMLLSNGCVQRGGPRVGVGLG